MNQTYMRSKELAELAGVTKRALRHYHQVGLLSEPMRDQNGYRKYYATDLVRVLRIKQLASGGMKLSDIKQLLNKEIDEFEFVSQLEENLAAQIEHLQSQLAIVKEIRRTFRIVASYADTANPTATQLFDQSLFALIMGSGAVNHEHVNDVLESAVDAVGPDGVRSFFQRFETLEGRDEIADIEVEGLARELATIAKKIEQNLNFDTSQIDQNIAAQITDLELENLNLIQQRVWNRFKELIS